MKNVNDSEQRKGISQVFFEGLIEAKPVSLVSVRFIFETSVVYIIQSLDL